MSNKRRICSKCEVSVWQSDFPNNFQNDICFFCLFKTDIENLTHERKSSKSVDISPGKVNTDEDLRNEIKDLREELKDLKHEIKNIKNVDMSLRQEIKDLRHEIKTIKNVDMSGKVNTVASPPVNQPEENTSNNSTKDVSKKIHEVNSDMISSFIRSLRPGNSDERSENPTDFHLDSNRTRPTLTKKVSLGIIWFLSC